MIRVSNIKLSIEDRGNYLTPIAQKLGISLDSIKYHNIVKESFDARKRHQSYVYTVDIEIENEDKILNRNIKNVSRPSFSKYDLPKINVQSHVKSSPIVVGSGPCGLFATYALAKAGLNPILLERGADVDTRVRKINRFWDDGLLDSNTNVQFGEGGAGTFSDGKLTTNIKNPRCNLVIDTFVKHGAPNTIKYSYQPHIGTDNLRKIVKNMREEILSLGGKVYFNSLVTDILIEDNNVIGLKINDEQEVFSDHIVLAIGHSARDTYFMLDSKNIVMEPKPFSVGLRIEHLQKELNRSQYDEYANHPNLDPASYKLKYHSKSGRSAYSFCMCPGGVVVASSSNEGEVVTNGMSYYNRAGKNANSAILVGVNPNDFESKSPLSGVDFQKELERKAFNLSGEDFSAPIQLVGDFLENEKSKNLGKVKPTYRPGVKFVNLVEILPSYVTQTLKEAIVYWNRYVDGFSDYENVLTGVETRSSAPLRIVRNKEMQASLNGLYVAGEGAGYAGGIMSAAVDGLKVAESIIKKVEQKNS
ncbi:MAG: NAD(P)/FAD-dependent oxidoreductase [Clostridia bacterium]